MHGLQNRVTIQANKKLIRAHRLWHHQLRDHCLGLQELLSWAWALVPLVLWPLYEVCLLAC